MSWPTATLAELTSKIGSGSTPRGGGESYQANGIPLIRSMNVHDGEFVDDGLAFLDERQAAALNHVTLHGGDVLLNITGASVARVCRLPDKLAGGRVNQHVSIIRPDKKRLDANFLAHLLRAPDAKARLLRVAGSGATREAITKTQIEEFKIPLPPLDEQRRIATILDKADELRRMRERTINLLDGLSQSIFLKMFNSSPAQCIPLKEVADLKRGPFGGALKKEIFVKSGFLVYEQGTVISGDPHSGRYFVDKNKYSTMKDFSVQPDDILVTCSGTLGAVLRARSDFPEGIINQALLRIRPDASKLRPKFLEAYLKLDVSQRFFEDFARGTGLKNFPPMSEVKEMPIPSITMDIQDEFLARRRKTEERLADATESSSALKDLFSSLQSRAFSGQL